MILACLLTFVNLDGLLCREKKQLSSMEEKNIMCRVCILKDAMSKSDLVVKKALHWW